MLRLHGRAHSVHDSHDAGFRPRVSQSVSSGPCSKGQSSLPTKYSHNIRTTTRQSGNEYKGWAIFIEGGTQKKTVEKTRAAWSAIARASPDSQRDKKVLQEKLFPTGFWQKSKLCALRSCVRGPTFKKKVVGAHQLARHTWTILHRIWAAKTLCGLCRTLQHLKSLLPRLFRPTPQGKHQRQYFNATAITTTAVTTTEEGVYDERLRS